jgi:hypothetical protein
MGMTGSVDRQIWSFIGQDRARREDGETKRHLTH